jgi:tRNA 2-thiouridine synthesizing protein E
MTQKSTDITCLNNDQKTVVHVVKDFYQEYGVHPSMRILIKRLKTYWPDEKANSPYLYKLFPENPLKQASAAAGIPPPLKCL